MPSQNIDVLLRLLNNRRFVSGMYAAGRSVRQFGNEASMAGKHAGFLDEALGTAAGTMGLLGTATTLLTEAIAGITVGVIGLGVQFNATMEGNALAFSHFAGSIELGKKLTQDLFKIARDTPFSFEDITKAARRFLAFGFNVNETTTELHLLGDAIAYTGGSTDEILRLTKALGDIRGKGRLMQQELNQLTNVGINWREVLKEGGLTITDKMAKNIGRAGVSSQEFFKAWDAGAKKLYGGGAKEYLNTFNGQWQRLMDNIKFGSGTLTEDTGLFGWLKKNLKKANDFLESKAGKKWLDNIGTTAKNALGTAIDWFGKAREGIGTFLDAIKPAQPFFENVLWPLFKGIARSLAVIFLIGLGVIVILAKVLGWIGEKAKPLKGLFETLGFIVGSLFGGAILKAMSWLGKLPGVFRFVGIAANLMLFPFRVGFFVIERFGGLIFKIFGKLASVIMGKIPVLGMFVNGVKSMAGKVTGFIGNMIVNVLSKFGEIGNKLFDYGVKAAKGFVDGLKSITKFLVGLFAAAGSGVINIGQNIRDWLNKVTPFGDTIPLGPFGHLKIPALATGGDILTGGVALVGERGPEIVRLPSGANVAPMRAARARANGAANMPAPNTGSNFEASKIYITSPIMLDRRQIGTAMGEYVAERQARR